MAVTIDGDGEITGLTVGPNSTTFNDIGTYAQFYNSSTSAARQYEMGDTASGSEFRKSNYNIEAGAGTNFGYGNTDALLYGNSQSAGATGTWRLMSNDSYSPNYTAGNNRSMYPALWVRVS